ncbi:MAG: O-antigen ligase family protein [Caulobacteraceae bacterium]|nr:O-antigen ligase family protein [Caulobacteraceae bacterium]
MPVVFTVAHLAFGANQTAAAQWLTAALGIGLIIAMATPLRGDAGAIELRIPAALFAAVLAVALWTLTPWGPGGTHPAWTWAEVTPGALTVDRSATVGEITKLLGLASAFALGALQGVRRDRAQATAELIVWIGAAFALVALLSFVSGLQVAQGGRLTGGFLSANSGATVFGVLTILGLALFLRSWRRTDGQGLSSRLTQTAVPITCIALSLVCLILTASRMGMAATFCAAGVLLVWTQARQSNGRGAILASCGLLIAVALLLLLGGNDLLWSRMGQTGPGLNDRSALFSTHWDAFIASPLFGWGLGSFDTVNLHLMVAETAPQVWTIRAAHNVYLQWLEEAGVVGATPMFLLIGWIIVRSMRRVGSGSSHGLLMGLICANLVILLHGLTDFALQVPSIAAFWSFLLGLQFTYGSKARR